MSATPQLTAKQTDIEFFGQLRMSLLHVQCLGLVKQQKVGLIHAACVRNLLESDGDRGRLQ